MHPFLRKAIEHISAIHGNNLGNVCIVLPNRRAKLYIQSHIADIYKKSVISPEIFSIEDFIIKLSGMNIADNIQLIMQLYDTHKSIQKEKTESFEEFIKWGQTLLGDFNDIDLWLVNPTNLFSCLDDAKNIAHWNPDGKPLTENQKKYIHFFHLLLSYYRHFTEVLLKKNEVYTGLAYRIAAENIENLFNNEWEKVYFAGLNALTAAEEKIIRYLKATENAELLWDADKYYIDNFSQEAGIFLRYHKSQLAGNDFKWIHDCFSEHKKIFITAVPKQIAQVKYACQLISEIAASDKKMLNATAVVLADENLLIPMLNSLPEDIQSINVTMGLPLKKIPLFLLFDSIFSLHINAAKLNRRDNKGNLKFYYKDIIKLFKNPYIKKITENKYIFTNITLKSFLSNPELQQKLDENNIYLPQIIKDIFGNMHTHQVNLINCLSNIIDFLYNNNQPDASGNQTNNSNIEREYILRFAMVIKQINSLAAINTSVSPLKSLHALFRQIVAGENMPFFGEPLTGMQIMGLLETRTLDFQNVILLSANENIIPSAKTNNSYIPYDIRKKFSLPVYHDKDAIFAYHFYRLLQRSKNIHLIYNSVNDDLGKGEKSRFISQILYELPLSNPDVKITNRVLCLNPANDYPVKPIIIKKSNEIYLKLKEKAKYGFSPTSLSAFIACPLKFYFSHVADIKENQDIEETIEAATLGNVIHKVLQTLYQPFINKQITVSDINKMLPTVKAITENAFKILYKDGDINYGKNLLIARVAVKFIYNFLKTEAKNLTENPSQLFIRNLEYPISEEIIIPEADNILIKGTIDRIDEINGITRIIDYKTGNINAGKELRLTNWQQLLTNPDAGKSLQLLIYSWLYMKKNNPAALLPAIFSFRKISEGLLSIQLPDNDSIVTANICLEIENIIISLISQIFNNSNQFHQTDNHEICKYCPYRGICIR